MNKINKAIKSAFYIIFFEKIPWYRLLKVHQEENYSY